MRILGRFANAQDYTPQGRSVCFPTHDGPCGIGTHLIKNLLGILKPQCSLGRKNAHRQCLSDSPLPWRWLSSDRAWPTKVPGASPFEMRAAIPMSLACCSTNLSPIPLYMISGTAGINRLSIRAASSPFITGIARSRTIRSGPNSCATRTASCPLHASPHTSKSASRLKISVSACRTKQLSSTIRTRLRLSGARDSRS